MSSAPKQSVAPRAAEEQATGERAAESAPPREHRGRARAESESGARAEPSLEVLAHSIARATRAVTDAREAGSALIVELETIHASLQRMRERQLALTRQLELLTTERDRLSAELQHTKLEAQRDRSFLIEEQDRFISGILEDHETALVSLTRERDELAIQLERSATESQRLLGVAPGLLNPPGVLVEGLRKQLDEGSRTIEKLMTERERARDVLRTLQAQRDEAQDLVDQVTRERDVAQSELRQLHADRLAAARTLPQPQPPSSRPFPADYASIGGAAHAAPEADLASRRTDPLGPLSGSPELTAAANASAHSAPAPSSQRPPRSAEPQSPFVLLDPVVETNYSPRQQAPLRQKPDPASTPLGAYSVRAAELAPEQFEPVRQSTKPPRR